MKIRSSVYSIRRRNAHKRESGVALIIALLSLLIVSTLAAGLLYATQSEIWTTSNYRAAATARYAAEAGVQQATYFLEHTWTPPAALSTATFKVADLPVTYYSSGGGTASCATPNAPNCVVLAPTVANNGVAINGITDTYHAVDSTTDTGFAALSSSTSPFPTVPGKPNLTWWLRS